MVLHDSLFDQWRASHFGGAAGAAADYDGDGVPNLAEYAFGWDPTQPQAAGPFLSVENNYLTLTLDRFVDLPADVSWHAEVSTDLVVWESGPAFTTTLIDDANTLKVRDNIAIGSGGSRRFLRLRVSRP
jgi:hypothetical protein